MHQTRQVQQTTLRVKALRCDSCNDGHTGLHTDSADNHSEQTDSQQQSNASASKANDGRGRTRCCYCLQPLFESWFVKLLHLTQMLWQPKVTVTTAQTTNAGLHQAFQTARCVLMVLPQVTRVRPNEQSATGLEQQQQCSNPGLGCKDD